MQWRARDQIWTFPRAALVMGVVNVTPDSFSDGGSFHDRKAAIAHGLRLIDEGADIIDVGGESTRPGAAPVDEKEELRRVTPVIEALADKAPVSVDTTKPAVARAAVKSGAAIINDVAGNRADFEMWEVVAEARAGYVLMHMQGTPQTMQDNPRYKNLVEEVNEFFNERLKRLNAFAVASDQVVLDVGIGFGKTVEHNLQLLAGLKAFTKWKRPILLGASRKGFIGRITGAEQPADRLAGSLACACWGVAAGANIIRAHDVAATRQAVRMSESILQWTQMHD
jgi:dihydropteroate synthase